MALRPVTLLLSVGCALFLPGAAQAVLPSIGNSHCPGFIRLVGSSSSGPDVTDGLFTVTVLDGVGTGSPIQGSRVTVSFCGVADLRICQDQQNPAYTVNCANGTVSALTDAQGNVDFTILGGSTGQAVGSSLRGTVKIFADDPSNHQVVQLSSSSPTTGLICSAPDEDGAGGLAALDFGLFAGDLGSSWQRSDFNGDGIVDENDQAILQGILFSGRMTTSCTVYCAPCVVPTRTSTWGALKSIYR